MLRKLVVASLPLLLLVVGCASAPPPAQQAGSAVEIHLRQQFTGPDTIFFRGPVPLEFILTVCNPLETPVTLRRIELQTRGRGAYALRTEAPFLNEEIAAGAEVTLRLWTWGRSRGGILSRSEPVTITGVAWFDSPGGSFTRIFMEYLAE
jgi:hypothetical protein